MAEEIQIIHSPLEQTYSADGHTLHIEIYRSPDSGWILEVVDDLGTSTVWDDPFDTDTEALEAALEEIESEGVHSFVTEAQREAKAAEPEQMRKLAQVKPPQQQPASGVPDPIRMIVPLSEEELDELDRFLADDDSYESMTLDMLDGFLHAIAIGPETVMPSKWLPLVWGEGSDSKMPRADDMEQVNRILSLVMRHYNSIVWGFERRPPVLLPLWGTAEFNEGEFDDAEMWAYGFTEAVKLTAAAWQPLLDDPTTRQWYRPIGLLGVEDFEPGQDALTRTPEQRQVFAEQIESSLQQIHAYWLPLRQRMAERQVAQRTGKKVGRNEPCPCGSGKKFKKCCGGVSGLQ
ncbi:MAG: UPF0149 family protein [Pseudomonadota bacterium]